MEKLGIKPGADNTESAGFGSHSSGMVEARMLSFGMHVVPVGTYLEWGAEGSWVRTGGTAGELSFLEVHMGTDPNLT